MGQLAVTRAEGGFGLLRRIVILVDGRKVGGLLPGERAVLDIPDGPHQVRARMDWVRTRPVPVESTGARVLEVEVSFPLGSGFLNSFTRPSRAIRISVLDG